LTFGPAADGLVHTNIYTYAVTAAAGQSGAKFFTGSTWLDGVEGAIAGDYLLESTPPLHPADVRYADQRLSLMEVTAYGTAWKQGTAWPVPPARVPTDYFGRAASLWREGEWYAFDASITNAPNWWVSSTNTLPADVLVPLGASVTGCSAKVERSHFCTVGEPITVTITVTPDDDVSAYAVEDQLPPGWTVAPAQIGNSGIWDQASAR